MMRKLYISIFLFFYLSVSASTDLKIISSTESYLLVEYTPVYSKIDTTVIDGNEFISVNILNGISRSARDIGLPNNQIRAFNVGVPSEFGNNIQVLNADYSIVKGKLIPVPFAENTEFSYHLEYKPDENYSSQRESELVTFGNYGQIRDLPVQTIKVFPIQFDAAANEIKLYKRIRFRINFSSTKGATTQITDKRMEGSVINFSTAKKWGVKSDKADRLNKISSVSSLNTGTWYKFTTPTEGMYKIDYNSLSAYGIDPSSVDPRTIRLYSNGGEQLSEYIALPRAEELNEIAIQVVGESDGKFDANDYIVFYGRSPDFWKFDNSSNKIIRNKHFYSQENYYFITAGGANGKRIAEKPSLNQTGAYQQSATTANVFKEDDRFNITKSGRIYVGDSFSSSSNTQTYLSTLTNVIPGSKIDYKISFVNYSDAPSIPLVSLQVSESGNQILSRNLFRISNYQDGWQNVFTTSYAGNLNGSMSTLKFVFNASSPVVSGYLDFFEIQYQSYLRASGDVLTFFSKDTTAIIEYNLSDFSNSAINLYDVTDFSNVKIVSGATISGGQLKFQASETEDNVSKYIAGTSSQLKSPINPVKIDNSNLRGDLAGTDFIIISNKLFKSQAERLRDYRSSASPNKISTKIIYIDEIFNEFSNGVQDPTAIRNFLKFAFENWQPRPFYVLFFGDGSYDYYNKEGFDNNFIPTYQTVESFNYVSAFPSDDYFVKVTGDMDTTFIDFGHGRININTAEQGEVIIDKIIEYETEQPKGLWRNKITLVADDGWTTEGDDGALHTRDSETLARSIIPSYFDQNKIYLAAYPIVNTGLGRRKPDVNVAIIDAVNNGTLILNFVGHGNRRTWAHERVFEREVTIPQFKNTEYFFMTAATCNFGEYDNPGVPSATEEMLLIEDRGMIGGFSASRPVYANQNAALNESFFSALLGERDSLNQPVRIGWAHWKSKHSTLGGSDNSEKFHIFCDPTLKLNMPQLQTKIDSINGQNLDLNVQLSALGNVKIDGKVIHSDSTVNLGFNGEAIISVFDSERNVSLKELSATASMVLQGGVIFRGRVSVTNGKFSAGFVVPKDISYDNKNGKVVAYVLNEDIDGVGFTNNILVGGTDSTVANDGSGPEIDIYYDSFEYENSYMVNPDFTLLVKLNDETGLNTTGTGVGHKLEGIINDNELSTLDLTNSFIGDLDSGGKSGSVEYKFTSLDIGDYNLKIKAWDVFNNSSIEESYFTVVNSDDIVLRDVVNYPNPFNSTTTFTFQHNLNSAINIKIKVYTVAGRLIKEIENDNILEKFVKVPWDGLDEDGSMIANGTYFYKLIVKAADGSFSENVLGKMAVIR